MQELGVGGETMLCVGARDDCEVQFFIDRGYEAIGIDLYTTEKIIKCDMAKIDRHPILKDMRFDVVFSHHSLEHCLDLDGFVRSLRLVCSKYFVCMMPYVVEPGWWDCCRPAFADYKNTDEFDERLIKTFPGFKIVTNELHKHGSRGFFILQKESA